MGLPDVAPIQKTMLREWQERMMANVSCMQPTEMVKAWLPMGIESWLEIQKAFWTQMSSVGAHSDDKS